MRVGNGRIGVLPNRCDPRRPLPPCRSQIYRYANARTFALVIVAACWLGGTSALTYIHVFRLGRVAVKVDAMVALVPASKVGDCGGTDQSFRNAPTIRGKLYPVDWQAMSCLSKVESWPCAPKARIITGGRFHPESCRLIR